MPPLSRRDFLELSASTAALAAAPALTAAQPPAATPRGEWFRSAWRRAVIDMHIPDWDPAFLSRFDPEQYAERLVTSRAQSIVCYCQSHVGLFNYPTQVGRQHAAFEGRNVLGEMIDACHRRDIAVQLYTSLIFDRTAADEHPEWRMRTWDGKFQGEGGRHGVLCVNSPYREYVRRFVTEICQTFDFEGIRFDMTFWPWLCYCDHCKQRFTDEVGGDIPLTVDWLDEKWVAFQRRREAWLVEFAKLATDTVREHRPTATVEHQASTFPLNWMFGVTAPLAAQNDFLQGDFYGDALQGSFVRKLLEELTPNRPFGYETSFSISLRDHTARKSEPLLEAKAAAAIADQAAFIFIDAIDPVGTVNPHPHERMGRVFERLMPYYEHLGGRRVRDIAVYYSPESKFDFATSGRHVSSPDTSDAHTQAAMQAARRILEAHLPLGVVTKQTLLEMAAPQKPGFLEIPGFSSASDVKLLILSNVNMLDDEEADAIRAWVRAGGCLYASGATSLVDKQGRRRTDFALADVFGVSAQECDWKGYDHYLAPTEAGRAYFPEFDATYPAFTSGYNVRVTPHEGATVLATTTLPWPAPDPSRFASIHSNPPWEPTDRPEIVGHAFGQGHVIYSAGVLETLDTLTGTFLALLRSLCPAYTYEVDAPAPVEATLFHQPDRNRYVLSLVNFQKDLPNIPVDGMTVRLRLPERVGQITHLPEGRKIHFRDEGGVVTFTAPRLETLVMCAIGVGG